MQYLSEVSIKRTSVTPGGIMRSALPAATVIHVAHGQFSAEELERLRSKRTVLVDAKFPMEDW